MDIRSVVAHNVHKVDRIGRVQEGGTGLLLFGPLTEYLDIPTSEKDVSGLGRWTTMLLKEGAGVQIRIICGYNPCQSNCQDNSAQATLNNGGIKFGILKTTSYAHGSSLERTLGGC